MDEVPAQRERRDCRTGRFREVQADGKRCDYPSGRVDYETNSESRWSMTNEELRLEWSSSVADANQAIDLLQAAKNGDDPETTKGK